MGLQTLLVGETLYYITNQPKESTKNLKRCISICPTKVSRSSFKQPRTQVLIFGNSWINCGMKGLSCDTMKAFIKYAKIHLFFSFNFLEKYSKHLSMSSCVWPTTRNPNLTFWRTPKSRGETHLRVPQSQVAKSWDLEARSRLPTLEKGRGSSWEPRD